MFPVTNRKLGAHVLSPGNRLVPMPSTTALTSGTLTRRHALTSLGALALLAPALAGCGVSKDRVQLTATGAEHTNEAHDVDINTALEELETEHGVTLSLAAYNHAEGKLFLHRGNEWTYEASVVKVPIALTLLRLAVFEQRTLTEEEKALIRGAISYSDNGSTAEIYRRFGAAGDAVDAEASAESLNKTYELLGAEMTRTEGTWGDNRTWAEDQVKIMRFIVEDIDWINHSDAEFLLEAMAPADWSQTWGVGAQENQEVFGEAVQQVSVKNGWIQETSGHWHVNSVGVVRTESNTFSLALLSKGFSDVNVGYEVASQAVQAYFDRAG